MDSSDIIALVAILVSAIFSYIVTRESIKARRIDIAYEDRIKAFKEIIERCGEVKKSGTLSKKLLLSKDDKINKAYKADLASDIGGVFRAYQRYRIYLTPKIEKMIYSYWKFACKITESKSITADACEKWFAELVLRENKLVSEMQKVIGIH